MRPRFCAGHFALRSKKICGEKMNHFPDPHNFSSQARFDGITYLYQNNIARSRIQFFSLRARAASIGEIKFRIDRDDKRFILNV